MEKYISLNAIVAEIKRRISEVSQLEKASYEVGLFDAYKNILSFLNTLEVKEVDLEKEIEKELNEEWYGEWVNLEKFKRTAKHFYELGLKAQKGEYVMSKVRQFIEDCTRGCSNELCAVEDRYGKKIISYHEWLTPEQALAAVEIAREELIDKACEWLNNFYSEDRHCYLVAEDIKAFKQAMEE